MDPVVEALENRKTRKHNILPPFTAGHQASTLQLSSLPCLGNQLWCRDHLLCDCVHMLRRGALQPRQPGGMAQAVKGGVSFSSVKLMLQGQSMVLRLLLLPPLCS